MGLWVELALRYARKEGLESMAELLESECSSDNLLGSSLTNLEAHTMGVSHPAQELSQIKRRSLLKGVLLRGKRNFWKINRVMRRSRFERK